MEWIDIRKKLPKKYERILFFAKYYNENENEIFIGIFNEDGYFINLSTGGDDASDPFVTHWMSLPEEPK